MGILDEEDLMENENQSGCKKGGEKSSEGNDILRRVPTCD
jgi:hypothetical protein